ncbi:TPA: transcriptional regulator [Neisseria subflava]|uniref:transcriptional regulator n=2 Tax=Neisseria TaxID=482 RepID=UPI00206E2864|nr:MAG TPA: Putative antitoxin of bacterial toxin-antitoxin system, YdaS/YdaT [Caudoviricetes sp.]
MTITEFLETRQMTVNAFSRLLGCHQPDLTRWAKGTRPVPAHWCVVIEQKTDGAVTRKDLRPNDFAQIWPELAA